MFNEKDKDMLWIFSGLSTDYILKVCCAETVEHVLRLKFPKISCNENKRYCYNGQNLLLNKNDCLKDWQNIYMNLKKQSLVEFFSLLRLENLTYKEQLQGDIFDYLEESKSNSINPWGYFDFRLQKYQDLIDRAVNNVLNQYLEQQDYERCRKIIQEISAHALRKTKILHIIFLPAGGFILMNEYQEILETHDIKEEMETAVTLGLKLDDVLSAVFIYYAPEKIVVHQYQNAADKISPMVWDLVGVAIDFCKGCQICDKYAVSVFADV